jgi:hypothetical protein
MKKKTFKPFLISEHILHLILVIITGGARAVIWIVRVLFKQRQFNKMTPEERAAFNQEYANKGRGFKKKKSLTVSM